MSKIFVVAGNYEQFRWFRKELGYAIAANDIPIRFQDIVYVSGPEALRGHQQPWGYMTGTWYEREDIDDIRIQSQLAGATSGDFIETDLVR